MWRSRPHCGCYFSRSSAAAGRNICVFCISLLYWHSLDMWATNSAGSFSSHSDNRRPRHLWKSRQSQSQRHWALSVVSSPALTDWERLSHDWQLISPKLTRRWNVENVSRHKSECFILREDERVGKEFLWWSKKQPIINILQGEFPLKKKKQNKEKQRVEDNIASPWTVPTTPAGALSESLTTVHHKRDKQQLHSQNNRIPDAWITSDTHISLQCLQCHWGIPIKLSRPWCGQLPAWLTEPRSKSWALDFQGSAPK